MAGRGRPRKDAANLPPEGNVIIFGSEPLSPTLTATKSTNFTYVNGEIVPPEVPLTALRRRVVHEGWPVSPFANREELAAFELVNEPETPEWEFKEPSLSRIEAVDPRGNWSAVMSLDGEISLTSYAQPNLNSRAAGVKIAGDTTMSITEPEIFVERIMALLDQGYPMMDKYLRDLRETEDKRIAEINAQSELVISPPPPDPDEVALVELGTVYGFSERHDALIMKLADALGIAKNADDPKSGMKHVRRPIEDVRADVLKFIAEEKANAS